MIHQDWKIKGRSHTCCVTGQPFVENQPFYTALFEDESDEDETFIRRDYSVAAWQQERPNLRPFSHWRSLYEPPQSEPARREVVEKEGAESLLRRLIDEDDPLTENTRFILALMLERKKTLRETDSRSLGTARLRIYEHAKTGEAFIIRDPQLKLDQLESIQREVSDLLASRTATPTPTAPETAAPTTETPATEIPAEETPSAANPAEETPAAESPSAEPPSSEPPSSEPPSTESPSTESPSSEPPSAEPPSSEPPSSESPLSDPPASPTSL
jgi:hypothetical protein